MLTISQQYEIEVANKSNIAIINKCLIKVNRLSLSLRRFPTKKTESGITLMELMISMAILFVIMAVGVPSMQGMLIRSQVTSQINELSAVIRYARHTAINDQMTAILCPTTNFSSCTADWDDPKMVFTDFDGNGSRGNDEEILAAAGNIMENFNLTGPGGNISFQSNGEVASPATLLLCHKDNAAEYARALTISLQGRVKLSEDSDDNGVHENNSGVALSCSS